MYDSLHWFIVILCMFLINPNSLDYQLSFGVDKHIIFTWNDNYIGHNICLIKWLGARNVYICIYIFIFLIYLKYTPKIWIAQRSCFLYIYVFANTIYSLIIYLYLIITNIYFFVLWLKISNISEDTKVIETMLIAKLFFINKVWKV